MKKMVIVLGIQAIVSIAIVGGLFTKVVTEMERNVNCVSCGEVFNNEHTVYKEMCDICFGWHECEQKIIGKYSEVE